MKYLLFFTVLIIYSTAVFSQKNINKIETYHEQCCTTIDSLRTKFNISYVFYIYIPRIDSCNVFIEKDGEKIHLPVRQMKHTNYYVVSVNDSSMENSSSVSIVSLKHKNRNIKFQLDPKYFFVRTAFLERGWVLEYTNKIMTIL